MHNSAVRQRHRQKIPAQAAVRSNMRAVDKSAGKTLRQLFFPFNEIGLGSFVWIALDG